MDLTKIKLPTAFLIAVFIFIGLQIGVAAISKTLTVREGYDALFDPTDRLPGIEETVIAWQLKNIRDDHNRADIILLGDSSCLVGLDPIRMEHALGVKVLNMGTIGWLMSEGHVDLLEAFIKRHGPPQLVVYHLSEELMQLEQHDIDASGFLYRLRVALGKEIGKDDFFNMLPMYKYRNELKKYRSLRKNENDYRHMPRGAWPSATDMLIELSRTKGHITDPTPGTYQYKPGHSFKNNENIFPGLMRLADLGQQYGFKIYFI